jgi:hypothetical protein
MSSSFVPTSGSLTKACEGETMPRARRIPQIGATSHARWPGWDEGHFVCTCRKNCRRRFRLEMQLRFHLNKGCWLCGAIFACRRYRGRHESEKHHSPVHIPKRLRSKGGRCSGCDWDFLEEEDWDRHQNIPLCDRTTPTGRAGRRLTLVPVPSG